MTLFAFAVRRLRWLARVPLVPQLFDSLFLAWTALRHPARLDAMQAVESAGKMLKEGAFESVKLEGGIEVCDHVRRIVRAGIPVMGHVGLTPQSVHAFGGFKVQGRGADEARILADARALDAAGAFAIVLEAIDVRLSPLAKRR